MNLNKIDKRIQQAICDLIIDEQFQKRFAEDKTLDYLDSLKHDKGIEIQELQLAWNKKIVLFGIELNPITLALYSYLYCIKSPIISDIHNITMIDLDIFFYLLQTKDYTTDLKQLMNNSINYTNAVMKINQATAIKLFEQIYKIEFRCLNLFPRVDQEKEALFNLDWMTSIVSKVKPLTSYTTEQLYTEISITQIYYYFANYCRMQGDQRIFIRTEDEILFEQERRMCQLVVDRIIQKGIILESQRDKIIELIVQEKK